MEQQIDIDALRDALKNENMWTDLPGCGQEWSHTVVMQLTQHGAEQTLRALCGPDITLATLLTQVSRGGLVTLVDGLEMLINIYATGNQVGTLGTLHVEQFNREYYAYRSLAETFERHGISGSMTRWRTNTQCSA